MKGGAIKGEAKLTEAEEAVMRGLVNELAEANQRLCEWNARVGEVIGERDQAELKVMERAAQIREIQRAAAERHRSAASLRTGTY